MNENKKLQTSEKSEQGEGSAVNALITAISAALSVLPSYEEHEFVDDVKCDIQFAKDTLKKAMIENK